MRLICPHCMSAAVVPDEAAGKDATCPHCGKSFPTPARYSAQVAPEAPPVVASEAPPPGLVPLVATVAPAPHAPVPPGYVPPAPTPVTTATGGFLPPAEAPAPAGYAKAITITVSSRAVAWLPAMLLTAVFVLTFFPWVGSYIGNSAVYSQRMWGAMVGAQPNRNFQLEQTNKIPREWLGKMENDWRLLVPFTLALILALVFAWAERAGGDKAPLPPLAKVWPRRNAIVAGLAVLMLFLLVVQMLRGFVMERAIHKHVAEGFADRKAKAAGDRPKLDELEYDETQEVDKYNLERTSWVYLALLCNVLAVLTVLLRVGLDNRGNKPPPKLVLHY